MARAEIVHTYDDGTTVKFTLTGADHPDSLDMLATRVCRMYRETVLTEEDQEP